MINEIDTRTIKKHIYNEVINKLTLNNVSLLKHTAKEIVFYIETIDFESFSNFIDFQLKFTPLEITELKFREIYRVTIPTIEIEKQILTILTRY